ncbi:MAG: DUF4111 domain-containing protein [Anaerolineales bacterium]|nr:DUF4111 domain-containing protein [Anaerolineales bacterium]
MLQVPMFHTYLTSHPNVNEILNLLLKNSRRILKGRFVGMDLSYTILTQCRTHYTLEHGDVVSKAVAAEWAKQRFEPEWRPLILRVWIGRQNSREKTDFGNLNGTLDFIRYTLGKAP